MKPVVVILGWMGSNSRQLSRVAQVYKGYETLTHTSPYHAPYIKRESVKEANNVIDMVIHKFNLYTTNRPVIFHTFSGQGCLIYTELIDKANSIIMKNHVAVIHDSVPAQVDIMPVIKAVNYTFKNNLFLQKSVESILKMSYGRFLRRVAERENVRHVNALTHPTIKKMFICSTEDKIVPQQPVIELAEKNNYHLVQFKTPHVQHHRYHFEEYQKHILQFIKSLES